MNECVLPVRAYSPSLVFSGIIDSTQICVLRCRRSEEKAMNQVNICGKIIRINNRGKVAYATIAVKTSADNVEFIPVTIFQAEFFLTHFHEKKWIGITGHVHVNGREHKYSTEIIADNIYFIGDKVSPELGV